QIVLRLPGRGTTSAFLGNIAFTLTQAFRIRLVAGVPQLVADGDPGFTLDDASPWFRAVVVLFDRTIRDNLRAQRDAVTTQANDAIGEMVGGIDFGAFLASLGVPGASATLTAAAVDVEGIILRGRVRLPAWSAPVVSFTTEALDSTRIGVNAGASWIPG